MSGCDVVGAVDADIAERRPNFAAHVLRRLAPASLHGRSAAVALAMLASLLLVLASSACSPTQTEPSSNPAPAQGSPPTATATPVPTPPKQYMLELINRQRTAAGLTPATMGGNAAAQLHADYSLANCTGGHWDVDGLKPYMRYSLAGGYQSNTENVVGRTYCDYVQPLPDSFLYGLMDHAVTDLWMNSPLHARSLLDPWQRKVNIGLAWDNYVAYIVALFETDYIRYEELPHIHNDAISLSGLKVNWPERFSTQEIHLALFYDPPPRRLTHGQIARTFCYTYGNGHPISEIQQPTYRGESSYISYRYEECPLDPYTIEPSPGPNSIEESLMFHQRNIEVSALRPLTTATVTVLTASTWTSTRTEFSMAADIGELLAEYGPGVYTVRLWSKSPAELIPISSYAIFHQASPPNSWQKVTSTANYPLPDL